MTCIVAFLATIELCATHNGRRLVERVQRPHEMLQCSRMHCDAAMAVASHRLRHMKSAETRRRTLVCSLSRGYRIFLGVHLDYVTGRRDSDHAKVIEPGHIRRHCIFHILKRRRKRVMIFVLYSTIHVSQFNPVRGTASRVICHYFRQALP